jgi:integrase
MERVQLKSKATQRVRLKPRPFTKREPEREVERKRNRGARRTTVFTEASVRRLPLPPPGEQIDYFEKLKRGLTLALRISYGGTRAWRVGYYVNGRPQAKTLGRYPDDMGVKAAREAAYAFDPAKAAAAAATGTFKEVAENWLKLYVAKNGLRTAKEIERILNYYVYPDWAKRPLFEIRRRDVSALLDKVEKDNGAPQADGVLATLRSLMNWHATRDDDYMSPIVKGMNRDTRPRAERARNRILSDDEIRAVWKACDGAGTFGGLVKVLLLTAQREAKVATMRREDISADGVWTIKSEPREKGNAGELRLPRLALDILAAQPVIDDNPFIFPATRGKGKGLAFNSFSQRKAELDAKLPAKMPRWTLHDLRRTARSLMARVGVSREHAERVLGHVIGGVEGTYDRHPYFEEKADALKRLAALVETILNPPDKTNVVPLPNRAAV